MLQIIFFISFQQHWLFDGSFLFFVHCLKITLAKHMKHLYNREDYVEKGGVTHESGRDL